MTNEQHDQAKQDMYRLLSDGIDPDTVAKRTGIGITTVKRTAAQIRTGNRVADAPLPTAPDARRNRREESPQDWILDLHMQGMSAKEIAAESGLTTRNVYYHINAGKARRKKQMDEACAVAARFDQAIKDLQYEVKQQNAALESQSQFLHELAERVETLEKRFNVVVPRQTETTIRNLTAERDLYRGGAASQQARADRLDERIMSLGLLPDKMHQELTEKLKRGEQDGREADQDLDDPLPATADEESEAD